MEGDDFLRLFFLEIDVFDFWNNLKILFFNGFNVFVDFSNLNCGIEFVV